MDDKARIDMVTKIKGDMVGALEEGNRNTKLFHLSTIIRRRKNYVIVLRWEKI
jgi:hypothetical protein